MSSPYDRRPVAAKLLGRPFRFLTAHGLFSADRVDDGTRLLLGDIPAGPLDSVLDLGCGYGALGLPLAAAHPRARFLLVDRDLVAVEYARKNALAHGLSNVSCAGSLGYRDVGAERFDLVLCNIPARIGAEAVAMMMEGGATRCTPRGQVRVVVIRDLAAVVEKLAVERGWPLVRGAVGERHDVFALPAREGHPSDDDESRYVRDEVQVPLVERTLQRPHDINEDPGHLKDGLPLLVECLPRNPKGAAFCLRAGYGAAPLVLAARGISVVCADRDLLATSFIRRNATRLGRAIETREHWWLPATLRDNERFSVVVGEISSSAGERVALEELQQVCPHLARGEQGLWLCMSKLARQWKLPVIPVATRGAWSVLSMSPLS